MIYLGETGLNKTHQEKFPKTTLCKCGGEARISFVYCEEGRGYEGQQRLLCDLAKSDDKMWLHDCAAVAVWLHDCAAVAVYFCPNCLEPTALYNQA